VQELLIASREIPPAHLERLKGGCRAAGVALRQFHMQLEDILPASPPFPTTVREAVREAVVSA
jgi:hypothetical protein